VIEGIARRDRLVVLAGLVVAAALAWLYLIDMALDMGGDMAAGSGAMMRMQPWSLSHGLLMWAMWAVMMVAMMAPSAAPMLLMFAALNRRRRDQDAPYVPTGIFLAGYVIVWTVFAAAATGGNWGLHQASLLSSMMGSSTSGYLGGALLLAAGAFQWSPLKTACLKQCRTPMGFLMTSWREGHRGALRMGLEHGAYCLGCCWALMLLLFVLGIMNLVWIAALAAFVLAEKVAPMSEWVSRGTGVLLAGWGVWAIVTAAM